MNKNFHEYNRTISSICSEWSLREDIMQDNNNEPPKAKLYGVGVNTINCHISKIYEDEELAPEATIRKCRIVQMNGEVL